MIERKYWGVWAGKYVRCPKCNAELLKNDFTRWCSFIECDYSEEIKVY